MNITIKNRFTDELIYEGDHESIKAAVEHCAKKIISLREADLRGANLYGTDLHGADLHEADLREADLHDADLYRAGLCGADLRGADLRDASLRGADLFGTNLRGADLYGADLSDAKLSEANLSGAQLHPNLGYFAVSPIGSAGGQLWTIRNDAGALIYNRGCFHGTRAEFVAAVKQKHAGTKYEAQYMAAVALIESVVGV